MAWQEPIYDRSQSDIDNKTKKGFINAEDLNRIETNIEYIASLMGVSVETKKWYTYSLPTSNDLTRIGSNIDILKEHVTFTTYPAYPNAPINTFSKFNIIESLIEGIEGDYKLVLGAAVFSGDDSYAGDNFIWQRNIMGIFIIKMAH